MTDFPQDRELVLTRLIDAPRDKVFRCWTDPDLIPRWFTPPPWTVSKAEVDLRPGGKNNIVMNGPNGEVVLNEGTYLDVVPDAKLVFTDAFTEGFAPKDGVPFMVATLTFEEAEGGKTHYTARVRHWTAEAKQQHEAMGFHTGWGISTDQLEAVAKTL
jgi:uncharacterized protein YndB with AHSA1/START domain